MIEPPSRIRDSGPRDPRPDGESPPSTFYLFVDGDVPPQPMEIEARLVAAGFAPREAPPGWVAGQDEGQWHRALELDGSRSVYLFILLQRDPDFSPWEWCDARWASPEEFEASTGSRWVLVVECFSEVDRPTESFHHQLRVASAVSEGLAVACYDESSTILRSATTLDQLAACPVPPAPSQLFEVHCVGDEHDAWVHTHGLRRFDLPELELLGIHPGRFAAARTGLQWLASYLMGERLPSRGGIVEFGNGLVTELRPVEDYFIGRGDAWLGGPRDRDESHRGWRLALADPKVERQPSSPLPLAPNRLLDALDGDPVFWLSQSESRRRARLARERFALAAVAYFSERYDRKEFLVKVAVPAETDAAAGLRVLAAPTASFEASCEHMWFEVKGIDRRTITAELTNDPIFARYLDRNEVYTVHSDRVSHFEISLDGEEYTPETISELDIVTLRTSWQTQER